MNMHAIVRTSAKFIAIVALFTGFSVKVVGQSSMDKQEMMVGHQAMKMTKKTCQREPKKPTAYGLCLDDEKAKLDRLLTTWVNNHIFELTETVKSTGRKSALNMFNKAQKSFVHYRENNCRWRYLNRLPHDDANLFYKECYIRLTQARIDELSAF